MKNQIIDIEHFLMAVEEDLSHYATVIKNDTSDSRMDFADAVHPETVRELVQAVRAASRWTLPVESLSKGLGTAILQDIRNKLNGTQNG